MKNFLFLPLLLMVINAQAQDIWTEYSTAQPTVSTSVRSISIVDNNVTWLNMIPGAPAGAPIRRFARTVNGGTVWTTAAIDLGPNSADLEIANIHGISATEAYASVFPKSSGVYGGVWKTVDAGATWTKQPSAAFSDPFSFTSLVYFWNANEGIAAGDPTNGYFEIYRTTDGGNNWTRLASTPALVPIDPQEYCLINKYAVSGNSIWMGTNYGRLLHSTDKGVTWSVLQTPVSDFGGINGGTSADVAFSDANNGLIQDSDWSLYKTFDGGATWAMTPYNGILRNFDIAAVPGVPNAYVSVGEDIDLNERGSSYSADGGINWISINDNPDTNYVDGGVVEMFSETVGFASGFSESATVGGIFRWNGTPPTTGPQFGSLLLKAFIDSNNNNIKDQGEAYYTGGTFSYQINSGTTHYINISNGQLFLPHVDPADSYNLGFSTLPGTNCSSTYTLPITSYNGVTVAIDGGTVVYNFPVVPTGSGCTDLSINLFPNGGLPRPSVTYGNNLIYKNTGDMTIPSGTITFTKDPNTTITSFTPSGPITTPTGFTYTFTNLLPNEQRSISVNMILPAIPAVSLGQIVNNHASITPSDSFEANNSTNLSQRIVASFDPNDITETHGGKILHSTFTSDDFLTYVIRFENTGTAEAFDINVQNQLDAQLDETSIRMVDASHDYTLERVGSNLSWNFADINLPPSVENTTIGKGYIVYQIKPKPGYAVGDIIPNTASIYFDTNPAVVTNTFNTEFIANLSVNTFDDSDFGVYPNPTSGLINIWSKKNNLMIESIALVDVLGKEVFRQNVNLSSTSTDISALSRGVYFLKVKSNGVENVVKILRE